MSTFKTIGILGGMGPEATAELYKRIIAIYQQEKGAVDDADFPNILINSVPAEDMLNDLANRRSVIVGQLQKAAQVLEQAGAEFIAIPCNTATLFLEEMQSSVTIPILNITELACQYVQELDVTAVGILASTSTVQTKIYEYRLENLGITMLKPTEQDQRQVNEIIMRILAGKKIIADRQMLRKLALQMKQRGASAVILGCTELPLLINKAQDVRFIDTIEVLASEVFRLSDINYKISSFDEI